MPKNESECRDLFDIMIETNPLCYRYARYALHRSILDEEFLKNSQQNVQQAMIFETPSDTPREFLVKLWKLFAV